MEILATESLTEDHPPAATKLRLMCSYGGQIVPRPHDKSLCYVGGETRIVVADRSSSLSDLRARLSKKILAGGGGFSLKYQLPCEDLDSLISVTTEEDLDNMLDEHDRCRPNRLRLFLFTSKSEEDDWFVAAGGSSSSSAATTEKQRKLQEVQSVPGSPMLENTSSFGSTSSAAFSVDSSALPHPPPPIEDQFAQMTVAENNDDRSNHAFGYRKQQQSQNPAAGVPDLTSPNSVSSDSSFGRTKPQFNDPIGQIASANMKSNVYVAPPYYQPVYYIQARPQQQYLQYANQPPQNYFSYAYDYSAVVDSGHQQVYYAGAPPPMASQYHTMATVPAQIRNSQPL